MDELESQIRQVLGDPAQMSQIMGLAQSLMGSGELPKPPEAAPAPEVGLGERLKNLVAAPGGGSKQQALLNAVRPYLSEKRQKKVDRAIRITRMAHLAKLALAGLGGQEHA